MDKTWYLYIVECRDGTLYTGITDDIPRRMRQHSVGKGAKYTRGRGPVVLRYQETCGTHSQALRREIEIKKLPRQEKLKLINPFSCGEAAKAFPRGGGGTNSP